MSLFTDLLANFQAERHLLLCLEPYDRAAAAVIALYYSSHGFTSEPGDTPANTPYSARLKKVLNFKRSLVSGNKLSGPSLPGFGTISLNNDDGALDVLRGYAWRGRRARLWLGSKDFGLSDYGLIFDGRCDEIEFGDGEMIVHLQDIQSLLQGELQTTKFLGTGGVEGAADLANKLKPFGYGVCRNIDPVYLGPDTGNHIFAVGDGPIVGMLRVLDVGVELTFVASAPVAGEWTVDVATGVITLGGAFDGPVTADFIGRRYLSTTSATSRLLGTGSQTFTVSAGLALAANMKVRVARTSAMHSTWMDGLITSYSGTTLIVNVTSTLGAGTFSDWTIMPWGTVAGVLKHIATQRGVSSFTSASFTALDAAQSATICGGWHPEGGDAITIMDEIADGSGCFYGARRNGEFDVGRFSMSGSSAATFDDRHILAFSRERTSDPNYEVVARYRRNHKVFDLNQVDGTAADADKTFLTNEWREAVATDSGVLTADPQSERLIVDSVFDEQTDAAAEAARLLALYGAPRDFFRVTLKTQMLAREINDTLTIERNRYGLDDGVDLVVVELDEDFDKFEVECGLSGLSSIPEFGFDFSSADDSGYFVLLEDI